MFVLFINCSVCDDFGFVVGNLNRLFGFFGLNIIRLRLMLFSSEGLLVIDCVVLYRVYCLVFEFLFGLVIVNLVVEYVNDVLVLELVLLLKMIIILGLLVFCCSFVYRLIFLVFVGWIYVSVSVVVVVVVNVNC